MESSKSSVGLLALALLGGVVAIVLIGEAPRLLSSHQTETAPPKSAPPVATPPAPIVEPPPPVPTVPTSAPPKSPPPVELRDTFNAELPAMGLPSSARIVETRADADRLTLVFDGALRGALGNLSALDGWIEALSQRANKLGYRHLDLRIRVANEQGKLSDVTIDSLVATPANQRPRPEPIDDGVRR